MSRLVILGGGESGTGAAVLGKVKGYDVFLSDSNMINNEAKELLSKYDVFGEEVGHSREKILDADVGVKIPGIPDKVPIVVEILAKGIPLISGIEFAVKYDN